MLAVLEMIGRHSEVLLDPSVERRVIRVRRHWAMLLPVLLQTVGIVLGVFLLSLLVAGVAGLWLVQSLLWYLAVGALIRLAWKVLHWWHEVLIVTDKRLMINSGIFETKSSMMPITKVTDMSYLRPFLGRYSVTALCGWSQRDRSRFGDDQVSARAGGGLQGDLRAGLWRQKANPFSYVASTSVFPPWSP